MPTVGARTRTQLHDTLAALEKPLSVTELMELEKLFPKDAVKGDRYAAPQMAHLDSEK